MVFSKTRIEGVYIIEPQPSEDSRGWFSRNFCKREFEANGLHSEFVQHNVSYNKRKGTLRGLHFQKPPHEEVKVVQCIKGRIFDVVVDLRVDSATYLEWLSVELCEGSRRMLYVPKGFAHGFQTLCDDAVVFYLMGDYYVKGFEGGLRYDDEALGIDWPIKSGITISDKDSELPNLR